MSNLTPTERAAMRADLRRLNRRTLGARNIRAEKWRLHEMCERLLDALDARDWQPIATAPRDGTVILGWFPYYASTEEGGQVFVMRWNDEHYVDAPRPYFEASGWVWGKRDQRKKQPTHWQPLPAPPEADHAE